MITKKKIFKEVRRLDKGVQETDAAFRSYAVLLASAYTGPNIKRIAKLLGYSRHLVAQYSKRLRKNKVWVGGKLHVEWLDKKYGGTAFICDALVADGLLKRSPDKD